jgi:uncharacterized protein (DUF488 family)
MAQLEIYTIGYEGAAIEDLIATLKLSNITRVVDVRESPYSKRPEFSTDAFAAALEKYGITYTHIRALGNPPAGREALRVGHPAVFREIIGKHLESEPVQAALAQAAALATEERICLMCMEKSHRHCHRSLVAERLHAITGKAVMHLNVRAKIPHPDQASFNF